MKFKIVERFDREKETEKYEVFYFDEFNSKGPKWLKVIWDEESYLNFCDHNFTATIEEAKTKAREFYKSYKIKNGKVIEEFYLD